MILEGALVGPNLPTLLDHLRRTRPTQRLLVLADAPLLGHSQSWPAHSDAQLIMPSQVPPSTLVAAIAPWLTERPIGCPRTYSAGANRFSRRELEVLRLVVDDCCNEEIANRLFINVRTVESHRRNLLQKAGTRTLVGLAARAVREGWVA
jgi:DNA-binding NarL/FixJ family response regulator